jgi:hypothetical protein
MTKPILSIVLLITSLAVQADPGLPEPFTATYSLRLGSLDIGKQERRLAAGDKGQYIFHSESKPTGLLALFHRDHVIEESVWTLKDGEARPLEYTYHHSGGKKKRDVAVRFDWEHGRIENRVGEQPWKMATVPHILDKLLYHWVAMRDLEKDSGKEQLVYQVADGGKVKTIRFVRIGKETLSTPLGRFETLKFKRSKDGDDKRFSTLWCAPSLHYLPVRVDHKEKDGSVITAEIETLSGLTRK